MTNLILGSASPYRQAQLRTLGYAFTTLAPDIDERRELNEEPVDLARRLASEKAKKIALSHPTATIIGADQVPECDGRILTKPSDARTAIETLQIQSGRTTVFHSAVAVRSPEGRFHEFVEPTVVTYRELSHREIDAYVQLDKPFGCAGAIKSESRGALLFNSVTSNDPSALIGLPLIRLASILRRLGLNPLLRT